jgi:hypothetical protein
MAVLTTTYAATAACTVTNIESLTSGAYASTTQVSNTSTNYIDVLVGGVVVTSATPVAGDTIDIYIVATYSDTDTDVGGAVDTTGAIGTATEVLTETTEFITENTTLLAVVVADTTSAEQYHWGPVSIASAFGGTMPRKWTIIVHNNTTETMGTGNTIDYTGVTYTST